jgi:DNA-binding IclR family transcriptional regulator
MSTEIAVLRALLLFSRRSAPPSVADLLDRVGCDALELERAVASLEHSQLVQRSGPGNVPRLTLAGLAVAVAAAANARRAKTVARPKGTRANRVGRVIPMRANIRRGRAA